MGKIKVLNITKGLGRGGAETLLLETAKKFNKDCFEHAYLYFLIAENELVEELEEAGSQVHCIRAKNNMSILLKSIHLSRVIDSKKYDIIHLHSPALGVIVRLIAKLKNIPIVYTEHSVASKYNYLTQLLNRYSYSLNNYVIAVSKQVEKSVKDYNSQKIKKISNAVDTNFYYPTREKESAKKPLNIDSDIKIIGTVAVFRKEKRLDLFLKIAKKIKENKNVSNCLFLIVGGGPEESKLKSLVRKYNLSDIVRFTGKKQEVKPYLEAMDIYVMTSEFEGLPIALLEAMSMKLPPVVTNVGGISEVIEHGENGFLAEKGNVNELTKLVTALLENGETRKEVGNRARQTVCENNSIEHMTDQLAEIYKKVIQEH